MANQTGFGGTTLAVACGIILAPFLVMMLICGGCITIGTVGTVGTGAAISAAKDSQERIKAESMSKENAEQDQRIENAEAIVNADEKRFADELAQIEEAKALRQQMLSETDDLSREKADWLAGSPEPTRPEFKPESWTALISQTTIKATVMSAGDGRIQLKNAAGKIFDVEIEKLEAVSRTRAKQVVDELEQHRDALNEWTETVKDYEARIAGIRAGLPEIPDDPSPVITMADAEGQISQEQTQP